MAIGDVYDVEDLEVNSAGTDYDFGKALPTETGFNTDARGLSQTGASAIGAGVQAAGSLAQGIGQSIQMGKLSEQAYQQGLGDIEQAGKQMAKSEAIQERSQDFLDRQMEFQNYQQDAALRQTRMMRDFQDEMERVGERKNAANKVAQGALLNENFRDAIINMNRGR